MKTTTHNTDICSVRFYMSTIDVQSVICYEDAELKSSGIVIYRRRVAQLSNVQQVQGYLLLKADREIELCLIALVNHLLSYTNKVLINGYIY